MAVLAWRLSTAPLLSLHAEVMLPAACYSSWASDNSKSKTKTFLLHHLTAINNVFPRIYIKYVLNPGLHRFIVCSLACGNFLTKVAKTGLDEDL